MNQIKRIFLLSFFSLSFSPVFAKYFQQEVNYYINVSLNDITHVLSCDEKIIYINNSDVKLTEIYFHLWPAAYKDRNTILAKEIFQSGDDRMLTMTENESGTIDSLDFKVNGIKVKWNTLKDSIDICKLFLNEPLNPGDSITITTPFRVKIPSAEISRLGHSKQAYYITQWFPKPAVYDENGWNYFPYSDQGEFYSEFGSFEVSITLPENYLLAATGEMIDAEKEIAWLTRKDSITRKIKNFPSEDPFPLSSKNFKTIHFRQINVHDFAWFADKRWHVLKDSIELPGNKRKIISWTFFNNIEANYWLKVPEYIKHSIRYFSEWIGEYPYNQVTAIDGGDAYGTGMEYPMITTIGNYGDESSLELTIAHEIAHNWFYGILGSNERKHPWMDEGLTNFFETRYVYTKYRNDSLKQNDHMGITILEKNIVAVSVNHRKRLYKKYLGMSRLNMDLASDLSSDQYNANNYHTDVYYKTSMSFEYLKSYLGDSLFDRCMKSYFNEWKFKHPQPKDIENTFETHSGKNLDWIFKDLLSTSNKLDYKISCSHFVDTNKRELEIINTGDIPGPFPVSELQNGKILNTTWVEGFKDKSKITISCNNCDGFRIDAEELLPEINRNNNIIKKKGLLKKTEKVKFTLGMNQENVTRSTISYLPVIGWNYYNKLMPGIVFHNISLYEKKFEYRLMPMYSSGTKNLAGGGDLSFHIYPKNNKIYRVTLRSGISRYAFLHDEYESTNINHKNTLHYTKIDSKIIFNLRNKKTQSNYINEFELRNIFIKRGIPYELYRRIESININYWQAEFRRRNNNPLIKSSQKINITFNEDLFNLTGETNNFFTYGQVKKGFSIRLFAGFADKAKRAAFDLGYRMSLSGKTGYEDYLFDEVFLGRTEEKGILAHQFVSDFAGFKTPTSFFRLSEKQMFGMNVNSTLPGLIPFRLFINAGTFDRSDEGGRFNKISWEAGVDLPLIKDIFVIYLPFAYSDDIKNAVESQKLKPFELVRFELHLNMLNPLNLIKKVYAE